MKVVDRGTPNRAGSEDASRSIDKLQASDIQPDWAEPAPTVRESADIIVWEEV